MDENSKYVGLKPARQISPLYVDGLKETIAEQAERIDALKRVLREFNDSYTLDGYVDTDKLVAALEGDKK